MSHEEQPRLEAWLDTDGDGDQLHLRVQSNGTEYERVDVDLDTLLQTEQFLGVFERPALTLLTAWERAVTAEPDAEPADADGDTVSTPEVS